MTGHVLEELPIAIDCFKDANVQLYFLTHAHSDHTVGLTKSWKKSMIYCTEVTAKLTAHRLGVRYSWFGIMEIEQEYIFKLRSEDDWNILTVTALPANHCPGSCMFVLETSDVKILYTGDFKPNAKLLGIEKNIWGPTNRSIDVVYVDNTYADHKCVLPSQENMLDEIVQLCKAHKDSTIFLGVYWTGHEDLLTAIATKMDQAIVVKPEQMAVLKLLGDTIGFTTNKYESDIHALPMHQLTKQFMREVNETEKGIAIIPTGRMCDEFHAVTKEEHTYWVPFSHHPSYSELQSFLSTINAPILKPIVEGKGENLGMGSLRRSDMTQFSTSRLKKRPTSASTEWDAATPSCQAHNVIISKSRRRKPYRHKRIKSCRPLGVVYEE